VPRLLTIDADALGRDRPPGGAWCVNGRSARHSAARFWGRLLWELDVGFPPGSRVLLRFGTAGTLHRDFLSPRHGLEQLFVDVLKGEKIPDLADMYAQCDLLGPPAPVRVSVLAADGKVLFDGTLPLDVADAEIAHYLLCWMLEWAHIPISLWNDESVSGVFKAGPEARGERHVSFLMVRSHVSEGLYEIAFKAGWGSRCFAAGEQRDGGL
jgi:hypothetical protein